MLFILEVALSAAALRVETSATSAKMGTLRDYLLDNGFRLGTGICFAAHCVAFRLEYFAEKL